VFRRRTRLIQNNFILHISLPAESKLNLRPNIEKKYSLRLSELQGPLKEIFNFELVEALHHRDAHIQIG
jgi:hypothetical protein